MATLRLGTSYWLDRYGGEAQRFGALRGHRVADVAIVGGGLTGCLAACLFARAGAKVVLLEAGRIGRGSTAASTALLLQEPDVSFRDLARRYGTATARRVWSRSRASLHGLTGLLRTLHAGAELQRIPSVYFTLDEGHAADLRRDVARRHASGLAGRWLSARALQRATGIDGAGGIITRGNAQFDPYRACLGIALGARRAGARLFENSPVRKLTADRTGVHVEHEYGSVRADWGVVATGYATPEFKPLAGRFRMMHTYVVATPPLRAATRREMGLGDVMLWDTERPYHYARWTLDRRLLFGGRDRPVLPRAARQAALDANARLLATDLADLYPALGGVEPDYAWEGLFAKTADGLPYVGTHRQYPRQLFALGYGGNGMTFGFMAAEMLLRAAQGRGAPGDEMFGFARSQRKSEG